MPITTTRRAASTGFGVLAATTALAVAAPSATAATTSIVLEPQEGSALASLGALPTDPDVLDDLLEGGGTLPLPEGAEGGEVVLTLPDEVTSPGEVGARFLTLEDALATEIDDSAEVEPLLGEELLVEAPEDGPLTVTFPVDALEEEDRRRVDASALPGVGVLVLDGLVLGALEAPVSTAVPLDTTVEDFVGPLELQGLASVDGALGSLSVAPGDTLELQVPETGFLSSLGLTDLNTAVITLVDLEQAAEAVDEATEGDQSMTEMGGLAALADLSQDDLGVVDTEVLVSPDGSSASLTLPEDAAEGTYVLQVSVADVPFESLEGGDLSELGVVAGLTADVQLAAAPAPAPAPVPVPTGTVTQPAPTVTAAPAKKNPGLRSNTGVEGGGASTGLVVLGGGLMALATGAGVLAMRTGRRGRA